MGWLLFIGAAVFMFWRQRSEGVVTVNPLKRTPMRLPGEPEADAPDPDKVELNRLYEAIQVAATEAVKPASGGAKIKGWQGREEVKRLVKENRFLEAMELYRRMYGVDLKAAKAAVDKLALSGE